MMFARSWLAHRASPQAEVACLHQAFCSRRPVPRTAQRGVHCSAHRIALLPGDGIGPEIADVAIRLLRAAGELEGESFEVNEGLIGGAAIDATGRPLPAETLQLCRDSDAVLLAAIGGCGPDKRALSQLRRATAPLAAWPDKRGRAGTSGTRWSRSCGRSAAC